MNKYIKIEIAEKKNEDNSLFSSIKNDYYYERF